MIVQTLVSKIVNAWGNLEYNSLKLENFLFCNFRIQILEMLIKSVRGNTPVYGEDCFFAENATLIGLENKKFTFCFVETSVKDRLEVVLLFEFWSEV